MIRLAHEEAVFSGSAKKAQQAIGMVAVEAIDMRHDIVDVRLAVAVKEVLDEDHSL